MSRIYAGSAHTVADLPASLYEELKFLLADRPDCYALLEFTSPGSHHRQVDCAVVSPGGIDLIEIKHKLNPVRGSADGAWETDDGGHLNEFSNRKAGRTENPYQQASNTADDLALGLANKLRLRREQLKVYPMVLIPEAHPDCQIGGHSRVHLALGSDALGKTLRAFNWKPVWSIHDYGQLPALLGLTAIELGSVVGCVMDAETTLPLRGIKINVATRAEPLETNFRGGFHFMAPLGADFALVLEPGTLHQVTEVQIQVSHRHIDLGNVPVAPLVTRAARQAALEQVNAEYQQRFGDLQAASSAQSAQVEQLTAVNQTLLDGLQREHDQRRTLERRLADALEEAPGTLTTQVQRRHELARAQEERERAQVLLLALRRPEVQASDDVRREAAEHLILMRAAQMPALPPSSLPDATDTPSRFRVTGRSQMPEETAPTGPQPTAEVSSAAPAPKQGVRWPVVALGALLLTGMAAGLWQSQRLTQPTAVPAQNASPALIPQEAQEPQMPETEQSGAFTKPVPAIMDQDLPGEVVSDEVSDEQFPSQPDDSLPGEAVHSE